MTYRSFSFLPTLNDNLLTNRFTQMDNLFSRLTGEKPLSNTPDYDLFQNNENYELKISLPGYIHNELDVSILNNKLSIKGKPNTDNEENVDEDENKKWLHKGIKKNEFSLNFTLEHKILIKYTNLKDGILIIKFTYDIPEKEKPQQITIGSKKQIK